jgi:hypothetical protein
LEKNVDAYLAKCQILIDLSVGKPIDPVKSEQYMIDELAEEGLIGANGLTEIGKIVAQKLSQVFAFVDQLKKSSKK